jgi:uncharacterized C2H2 Zn-finger protein
VTKPKNRAESTTTAEKPKIYKCPDCDAAFDRAPSLGNHRRAKHGIAGSSATATKTLAARRTAVGDPSKPFPCADCSLTFATETGLAMHRGKLHKIAPELPFKCPECPRSFGRAVELGNHLRTHGVLGTTAKAVQLRAETAAKKRLSLSVEPVSITTTEQPAANDERQIANVKKSSRVVEGPPVDVIAYALAVGSIKEFCRNFAEEHGIPTREFTRQCAELFYREARR